MSGTTQNIPPPPPPPTIAPPATDLDVHVDALVDRIDAAADSASKALQEIAAEVDAHALVEEPVAEPMADPVPETESPSHPDDVMSAVAGDIEHAAPGPLAEPPAVVVQNDAPSVDATAYDAEPLGEAVAPETSASGAAAQLLAPVSSAALDDALAAVADDLAQAESAHQNPAAPEPRGSGNAAGSKNDLEFQSPSPEELAAPEPEVVQASPPATSDRPGPDVRKLDDELAANAEKVLAQAQQDLQSSPSATPKPAIGTNTVEDRAEQPAAPKAEVAEAPPVQSAPIAAAVAAAVPTRAPDRIEPAPSSAPAPVVPVVGPEPTLRTRLAPMLSKVGRVALMPLEPLAAVHRKLGEEMRQTIGYCAILTGFIAACLWVAIPMLRKPIEHSPVTPAAEFYDPSKPAHGVTAPPRHESKGHGKEADAHGAAAKDDHGAAKKAEPKKAETKKADAHGAKKTTKKADAHH